MILLQGLRFSSVSQLPEPRSVVSPSSHSAGVSRSLARPGDLTTDHSMKAFRQMKLSNAFLGPSTSSITTALGNTYRQYSTNFSSTTSASKSRLIKMLQSSKQI